MMGMITAIAIFGGLFFYLQDRRQEKRQAISDKEKEESFSVTEGQIKDFTYKCNE